MGLLDLRCSTDGVRPELVQQYLVPILQFVILAGVQYFQGRLQTHSSELFHLSSIKACARQPCDIEHTDESHGFTAVFAAYQCAYYHAIESFF